MGTPPDDFAPFDATPSYEELTEIVAALRLLSERRKERIGELEELNRSLAARIADLEERLGRNPRNSSMPPSAEVFSKPPVPNRSVADSFGEIEESSREAQELESERVVIDVCDEWVHNCSADRCREHGRGDPVI